MHAVDSPPPTPPADFGGDNGGAEGHDGAEGAWANAVQPEWHPSALAAELAAGVPAVAPGPQLDQASDPCNLRQRQRQAQRQAYSSNEGLMFGAMGPSPMKLPRHGWAPPKEAADPKEH